MTSWHDMMHCFSRIAIAPQLERIDTLLSLPNTLVAYHPLMNSVRTLDLQMDAKKARVIGRLGYMTTLMYLYLEDVSPDGRVDSAAVQHQRLRVDARKWLLSKIVPKVYGDRVAVDHAGGVAINVTTGVPDA